MRPQIKRVYEKYSSQDGLRVLVDRLWPRGLSRNAARTDLWARDLAPSNELRKWVGHDPRRWDEFERRYLSELDRRPEAWRPLVESARRGPMTLLYAAKDEEHNNAAALGRYLEAIFRREGQVPPAKEGTR